MSVALTRPPALAPLLARGALLSPFKRPRPDADFPRTRLVLPGLRVDLARLAAYERVCGFATGEDALPVTYPHVLGFPLAMRLMSGRDFPLPLLGLVHTSIEITRYQALPATGEYELTVGVERLVPHRRGTEAVVVTEVRAGGSVRWESRSTYLARHRTNAHTTEPTERGQEPGEQAREPGEQPRQSGWQARETGEQPEEPGWQARQSGGWSQEPGRQARETGRQPQEPGRQAPGTDRRVPDTAPQAPVPLPAVAEWRLAGDVGRRYGAASGDRNPIHLHPLTARLFGFPRAIAHGMWTVARCLAAHGTSQAVRIRAEFRAPVLLPGTVTYVADGERFELRGGDQVHVSGEVYPIAS
ncbi:MaoC/PaaZ C-terminal domain-containing protein [Streptomyces sp. AC555_RSS877]|uniref:MaoC family dehydratase n=1 Tax=Streptomyces sp. AC555_RSS877 TaxID=2823688 RepID=UPI0020B6776C|nr:MaoC/PaaZ C-terminal domain-containing protein [Streptomyces sp. AC555_RSS877]